MVYEITKEIKRVIKLAGREVMRVYSQDFGAEIKRDNSPVTQADIKSDEIILKELEKFKYPILSEESKDSLNRLEADKVWIIDSLDGTSDFVQKTGEFSVMIGLVENGKPIMGFVYLPKTKKLYFAFKGKGSFLEYRGNTKRLHVSNVNDVNASRLVVSRNHLKSEDERKAKDMGIKKLKKSGSNGIKMGIIAESKADIFYNTTNKMSQWDSCAPEIILTEAGGEVTDAKGNKIVYNMKEIKLENGLVATNGLLHNEVISNL